MGRLNITHLPKPPKQFRPSQVPDSGFETKEAARKEDEHRIRALEKIRNMLPVSDPGRDRICSTILSIDCASSPASSVYMRKHRNRFAGNLSHFHELCGWTGTPFTLIPKWGKVGSQSLHDADAPKFLKRLRAALNRAGAQRRSGVLIAVIHCEYEPRSKSYQFHFHGYVSGDMIDVIGRLRGQAGFKTKRSRKPGEAPPVQRVHIVRAPLENLPRPFTYLMQGFWPEKTVFRSSDGSMKRQRSKHRIAEPMHSEALFWLDRWDLNDLVLLMGIRVTRSGFAGVGKRTPISK